MREAKWKAVDIEYCNVIAASRVLVTPQEFCVFMWEVGLVVGLLILPNAFFFKCKDLVKGLLTASSKRGCIILLCGCTAVSIINPALVPSCPVGELRLMDVCQEWHSSSTEQADLAIGAQLLFLVFLWCWQLYNLPVSYA